MPFIKPGALQRRWAAKYCGMSVDHFDRYVKPHLPRLYVGDLRLYQVADLDAWLEQQTVR